MHSLQQLCKLFSSTCKECKWSIQNGTLCFERHSRQHWTHLWLQLPLFQCWCSGIEDSFKATTLVFPYMHVLQKRILYMSKFSGTLLKIWCFKVLNNFALHIMFQLLHHFLTDALLYVFSNCVDVAVKSVEGSLGVKPRGSMDLWRKSPRVQDDHRRTRENPKTDWRNTRKRWVQHGHCWSFNFSLFCGRTLKYSVFILGKKGFLEENTLEHHLNIASSYNINQCEIACNAMHFLLSISVIYSENDDPEEEGDNISCIKKNALKMIVHYYFLKYLVNFKLLFNFRNQGKTMVLPLQCPQ